MLLLAVLLPRSACQFAMLRAQPAWLQRVGLHLLLALHSEGLLHVAGDAEGGEIGEIGEGASHPDCVGVYLQTCRPADLQLASQRRLHCNVTC